MKRSFLFSVALFLVVLLAACSANSGSATQTNPTSTPAIDTLPVTEGKEIQIKIADFQFSPVDIKIHVGTTLTWTNMDSASHTVTATDGAFDSGALNKGDAFSHTFEKEGNFTYYCSNHPTMQATVTVEP